MSKENLPISVDNNKSLAEKRKEKRDFEQIKRSAKVAISAGLATAGLLTIWFGASIPSIAIAGGVALCGFGTNAVYKKVYKSASKDSMFVLHKNRKGELEIGLIFKALKNSKIDVKVDELGESQIVYDSDRSLLTRVQEESTDKCEEYRKSVKKMLNN